VPAIGAGLLALAVSSDASTCGSADSSDAVFGYAILVAVALFAMAAFTSLFDAVRLARAGAAKLAVRRLLPLLASVVLGFGTLVLWLFTVLSCLE